MPEPGCNDSNGNPLQMHEGRARVARVMKPHVLEVGGLRDLLPPVRQQTRVKLTTTPQAIGLCTVQGEVGRS